MIIYRGFKIYFLTQGRYRVTRGAAEFVGNYPGGVAEIKRDIDEVIHYLYE